MITEILHDIKYETQKGVLNYEKTIAHFRKLSLGRVVSIDQFRELINTMVAILDMDEYNSREIVPQFSELDHLRACAWGQIKQAIYSSRFDDGPKHLIEGSEPELKDALTALKKLIKQELLTLKIGWDNRKLDALFWNIYNNPNHFSIKTVFKGIMSELEIKGFKSTGWSNDIEKSVAVNNLEMDEKTWHYCENELIGLLDSENYMIRAGAAVKLGEFFALGNENGRLKVMLELIAKKESKRRGVAGGFIEGLDDSCQGLYCLESSYLSDFDTKNWVFQILEKNNDIEMYTPNAQSLDFYIHEFFDYDPDAVNRLIDLDREALALETAMESGQKVKGMERPLLRLSLSKNKPLANRAKEYLSRTYDEL